MPRSFLVHGVVASFCLLVVCCNTSLRADYAYIGGLVSPAIIGDPNDPNDDVPANAILYRYDTDTKVLAQIEPGLDAVDSIALDGFHAYVGLRDDPLSPTGIVKRYNALINPLSPTSEDIQTGLSTVESLAVSGSRLYASLSSEPAFGGLIKSYPKTAPFFGGGVDVDIETGIGADKELVISSDGNTLYAKIPNSGGGVFKQYDVSDPNSPIGSDIEFGLGSGINMHIDEAADPNGRLIAGIQNFGGVVKTYDLASGAGTDFELPVGSGFTPVVTSGETSNGDKVFTFISANNGTIKQYDMLNPVGGMPGDIEGGLCGTNPGGCAAAVGDGHIQYANGRLYALFNDGLTNGILKSWNVDDAIDPNTQTLDPVDESPFDLGDPQLLEKVGDLLFVGTSANNGTLRVYDTISRSFVTGLNGDPNSDTIVNVGTFSAFAGFTGSVSVPGDFDGDFDVDGNDFLEWQRTDGTPPGLAAWNANYGTGVAAGAAAAASAVPEPSSAALAAIAATLWMRRRKRP